jgi:hypothetical protein
VEAAADCRNTVPIHRQVLISQSVDAGEHVREDLLVEFGIVCGSPVEEAIASIAVSEIVDIGEVLRRGSAK